MLPLSHLNSCTPTKSNLYLANTLAAVVSEPDLYRLLTFQVLNLLSLPLVRSYQSISPVPSHVFMFRNSTSFYFEKLSAPPPTPKLVDSPFFPPRNYLSNIFSATIHIGGCFSICSPRTCHALVTGLCIMV